VLVHVLPGPGRERLVVPHVEAAHPHVPRNGYRTRTRIR
jgi:hypothetical protein